MYQISHFKNSVSFEIHKYYFSMCIKGHKHESCLATKNNTIKEKMDICYNIHIYLAKK